MYMQVWGLKQIFFKWCNVPFILACNVITVALGDYIVGACSFCNEEFPADCINKDSLENETRVEYMTPGTLHNNVTCILEIWKSHYASTRNLILQGGFIFQQICIDAIRKFINMSRFLQLCFQMLMMLRRWGWMAQTLWYPWETQTFMYNRLNRTAQSMALQCHA